MGAKRVASAHSIIFFSETVTAGSAVCQWVVPAAMKARKPSTDSV